MNKQLLTYIHSYWRRQSKAIIENANIGAISKGERSRFQSKIFIVESNCFIIRKSLFFFFFKKEKKKISSLLELILLFHRQNDKLKYTF